MGKIAIVLVNITKKQKSLDNKKTMRYNLRVCKVGGFYALLRKHTILYTGGDTNCQPLTS